MRRAARALEQLGATVKNGKVTFPDEQTFQACVKFVNSEIVKSSRRGNVDTTVENFVAPKDLNALQRAYAAFAKELGVPIVFFRGDKNLHGMHANGISYYNVDAKFSHEFVYWHEFGHWLKNNQVALFNQLLDAAGITDEQIAEKRKSRPDLSDEDLREEIICDAMSDIVRRTGLLNQIGKKNQSLIQWLISWARTTLGRFTDWFQTRERGLTTAQRAKMYDAFGKVVRQIEDADGNKIFRYNSRTHEVELADGRKLPTVDTHSKPKYSTEAETKNAAEIEENINRGRKAIKEIIENHQDVSSAMHRDDIGDIDFLWGKEGDPERNYKRGYGISHIIARRNLQGQNGIEMAMSMPEVIMRGKKEVVANGVKIKIRFNNYVAVLTNNRDGQVFPHWLLTVFKQYETEPANQRGEGFDSSTPTTRTTTPTHSTKAASPVSAETISQEERDGKVKYSLDASDNSGESLMQRIRACW